MNSNLARLCVNQTLISFHLEVRIVRIDLHGNIRMFFVFPGETRYRRDLIAPSGFLRLKAFPPSLRFPTPFPLSLVDGCRHSCYIVMQPLTLTFGKTHEHRESMLGLEASSHNLVPSFSMELSVCRHTHVCVVTFAHAFLAAPSILSRISVCWQLLLLCRE